MGVRGIPDGRVNLSLMSDKRVERLGGISHVPQGNGLIARSRGKEIPLYGIEGYHIHFLLVRLQGQNVLGQSAIVEKRTAIITASGKNITLVRTPTDVLIDQSFEKRSFKINNKN